MVLFRFVSMIEIFLFLKLETNLIVWFMAIWQLDMLHHFNLQPISISTYRLIDLIDYVYMALTNRNTGGECFQILTIVILLANDFNVFFMVFPCTLKCIKFNWAWVWLRTLIKTRTNFIRPLFFGKSRIIGKIESVLRAIEDISVATTIETVDW